MVVSARLPEVKGPLRPSANTVLYTVSITSFQVIHTHPHASLLPEAQNRSGPVSITTAEAGAITAHWQLRHTGLAGVTHSFVWNVFRCFLFSCVVICWNRPARNRESTTLFALLFTGAFARR